MDDWIDRMVSKPNRKTRTEGYMVETTDGDELQMAVNTLLRFALHKPDDSGPGIREVGEKCHFLLNDVEAMMINRATGEKKSMVVGDFTITVEKVK
jgi:hypothetical protein